MTDQYTTPASVWQDTYDADYDDGVFVGSCECPHCGAIANHYNGPAEYRRANTPEFECIECGHQSTIEGKKS